MYIFILGTIHSGSGVIEVATQKGSKTLEKRVASCHMAAMGYD